MEQKRRFLWKILFTNCSGGKKKLKLANMVKDLGRRYRNNCFRDSEPPDDITLWPTQVVSLEQFPPVFTSQVNSF